MPLFNRRQLGLAVTAATASAAAGGAVLAATPAPLTGPAAPFATPTEAVPVAVVLDEGATIIDFGGPWETFQDAEPAAKVAGFKLFTVAPSHEPLRSQGGLHIIPDYDFTDAPRPRVIVIPAETGASHPAKLAWIREMSKTADIVLSICTGAFLLANTGLIDGMSATTHHLFYDAFATKYPAIKLVRGRRFVDNGKFVTAGGLTSSIDGALHIVSRFYGPDAAQKTARFMEHDGDGWRSGVQSIAT